MTVGAGAREGLGRGGPLARLAVPPGQQLRSSRLALSQPRRERRAGEPPREEVKLKARATTAFFFERRSESHGRDRTAPYSEAAWEPGSPPVCSLRHRPSGKDAPPDLCIPGAAGPAAPKSGVPRWLHTRAGESLCLFPWTSPTHSLGQLGKTKNPQCRNGDSNPVIFFFFLFIITPNILWWLMLWPGAVLTSVLFSCLHQ